MKGRPRITITCAQSLDGRIATRTGKSRWISGDETLKVAHELRNEHDAILVGIGTVLADNPQLTCRLPGGRNPHRVVLDSRLRTPLDSHIVTQAGDVPTTIISNGTSPVELREPLEAAGVHVVALRDEGDGLDLTSVMSYLGGHGIATLLVEGGSRVITSCLAARIVDRMVLVSAPLVIGTGTEAVGDLGVTELSEAIRGRTRSVRIAGNDIVWEIDFGNE